CLNLKVTYGSAASIDLMEEMMGFIRREAWNASIQIGAEKGTFPEFEPNREAYEDFLYNQIGVSRDVPLTPRNYEVTTIAPTGTISLVAETSSGIEPNFSWAYVRRDTLGTRTYVHSVAARALGIEVDQTDQEAMVEVIDKPACGDAVVAIAAPVGADAEVAARQQIQADTVASNQGESSAASGRVQAPPDLTAIRIERPRELSGATWQIPFDG